MNCYNNFARIYDSLISKDVDYEKFGKTIINICELYKINRNKYLDLACGTGNLTLEVGKDFVQVWAVDLSEEMLTIAEEKLRNNEIKAKIILQDMINLNLNRKFDLITCCLDAVNYITSVESLEKYFQIVYKHLEDKGIFIFDINSYYKLTQILGDNTFNYDDDEITYIWENVLENDIVNMYLTFFVRENDIYRRFDEIHTEKAYKRIFIEKILSNIGFTIEKIMDNYEGDVISFNSERIVYVLRK